MFQRLCLSSLVIIAVVQTATAQTDSSRWSAFPRDLQFTPLIANHEEAFMGLQQQLGTSLLTVGIGSVVDLFQYAAGADTFRLGGDFYSYSLSNSYRDVRLKIDAADGFFGLHVSWKNDSPWSIRFRALHLSAHFVDGHWNPDTREWKDGQEPIPYSRNYGEVVGAYEVAPAGIRTRLYSGVSYAVYNNPHDIRRWAGLAGGEIRSPGKIPLYAACNFYLMGVPEYHLTTSIQAGVKFGEWKGRGIRVYAVYFTGLDTFGQYYKQTTEFFGLGFAVDVW